MESTFQIPSLSAFDDQEGSVFNIEDDGRDVELELIEVDASADTLDGWERFSLVFRGPSDEPLDQGSYHLDHPDLGEFDATLVPVVGGPAPDPEWIHYEAVVDRQVPDRKAGGFGSSSRRGFLGRATLLAAGLGLLGAGIGSKPASALGGEDYIGSIGMFAGNFAPRGYALCDGQLLPISQYTALFSLLGTTYGGDGRTTFALPDLRGRVPIHPGNGPGLTPRLLGEKGGAESVALNANQIPSHSHGASADVGGSLSLPVTSEPGDATTPDGNVLAALPSPQGQGQGRGSVTPIYSTTDTPDGSMALAGTPTADVTVDPAGGGAAHDNMQPYLGINYVIALQGIYPSRS